MGGLSLADGAFPENVHSPTSEGIRISWGVRVGVSVTPTNLEFPEGLGGGGGAGGLGRIPSMEEVWIFLIQDSACQP